MLSVKFLPTRREEATPSYRETDRPRKRDLLRRFLGVLRRTLFRVPGRSDTPVGVAVHVQRPDVHRLARSAQALARRAS